MSRAPPPTAQPRIYFGAAYLALIGAVCIVALQAAQVGSSPLHVRE